MIKAKGTQGSWFATTREGKRLTRVNDKLWPGGTTPYHDPHRYDTERRGVEYIEAVKRGKVLITRNEGSHEAGWRRTGYVGVFRVTNVQFSPDNGLTFDIVSRD